MFAVPDLINLSGELYRFGVLVHGVIRILGHGFGWGFGFVLEDVFVDDVEVLHDVLFFDEFAHKLREGDWGEEVFGFLVLGGLLGWFGHGQIGALTIDDMLLLLTVSSYFAINSHIVC